MRLKGQVVAQQEVEDGIQPAAGYFGTVLQLKRSGSSVARIGKKRLLIEFTLLVQLLKTLPWQQDLASYFKLVGQVKKSRNLQRNRLDGDDIGGHIVALNAIATGYGTHQSTVLVSHRDGGAVIFHFTHNLARLATQAFLGAAQEVLHLLDAVTVGQ